MSVTTIAAMSQTKSSERITAVRCSIARPAAREKSAGRMSNCGGAAMLAVTIMAATMASSRTGLCIDPPRGAPQQEHERGIHGDEQEPERDLPDERRLAQRPRSVGDHDARGRH